MTGPGVVVTTATRSGPTGPLRAPSGQFFVVGLLERGRTDEAVLVQSMNDVNVLFGDRVPYSTIYDQLQVFFDEGGQQARVARVVGPGATKGKKVLYDRASGTAQPTLNVEARSAGSWSAQTRVFVSNGSRPGTFRMTVTINGEVVEDYNNLVTPDDAVAYFANSEHVKVTNLGSATAAPNNAPALVSADADAVLTAGTDDRSNITATHYQNALDMFTPGYGDGAVAIPGQTDYTTREKMIDHCMKNNRIALFALPATAVKADYITEAADLDTEFAGLFGPHLVVSDGGRGTRVVSPEGFVAACRARAHDQIGPWRAPAGAIGKANSDRVLGVSTLWTKDDQNDLDSSKVSVIRLIQNSVRLYGWRSLSEDVENYAYLKDRDLLNRLVVEAESRLEQYVFQPIDAKGQLLSAINAELVGLVDPIRQAGGLYENYDDKGEIVDPGYRVNTGRDVNTPAVLANNEVRANLAVRISPVGALVSLTIVKVGFTASL